MKNLVKDFCYFFVREAASKKLDKKNICSCYGMERTKQQYIQQYCL